MSDIDPNENLLRALGYESIEEIPGAAGRTINFDNAEKAKNENRNSKIENRDRLTRNN